MRTHPERVPAGTERGLEGEAHKGQNNCGVERVDASSSVAGVRVVAPMISFFA